MSQDRLASPVADRSIHRWRRNCVQFLCADACNTKKYWQFFYTKNMSKFVTGFRLRCLPGRGPRTALEIAIADRWIKVQNRRKGSLAMKKNARGLSFVYASFRCVHNRDRSACAPSCALCVAGYALHCAWRRTVIPTVRTWVRYAGWLWFIDDPVDLSIDQTVPCSGIVHAT